MSARARWIVIIGLGVAVAVVTPVILISQSSNKISDYAPPGGPVLVSNRDIQTGQELDPLIEEGVLSETWVLEEDDLIDGAITDLDQLRGTTALVDIPSNHQISANHVEQLDEPTP